MPSDKKCIICDEVKGFHLCRVCKGSEKVICLGCFARIVLRQPKFTCPLCKTSRNITESEKKYLLTEATNEGSYLDQLRALIAHNDIQDEEISHWLSHCNFIPQMNDEELAHFKLRRCIVSGCTKKGHYSYPRCKQHYWNMIDQLRIELGLGLQTIQCLI